MATGSSRNIFAIAPDNPRYPRRLETTGFRQPLYGFGDFDLNRRHVVAIVGTRSATIYASEFINSFVGKLAASLDDVLVISGLAIGCDSMAHRAALDNGIATVGVLAHGLDTLYPSQNRQLAARMSATNGGLLTQYATGTRMFRGNFLARNKVIAGLSDCVIVIESAAEHGGALHTARHAHSIGRQVFAVPGRVGDRYSGGCNMLIAQGTARLLTSADELIRAMGWKPRPEAPAQPALFPDQPSGAAMPIITYLEANGGEQTVDNIATSLGIPTGQLLALLIEMEFDGHISALPGNRYRINNVR